MICFVVGARPNFMKMAPVISKARERGLASILVHTGQHYDARMSAIFFDELGMPQPDIDLDIGSGSTRIKPHEFLRCLRASLSRSQAIPRSRRWRCEFDAGRCATAAKLLIPVAHVEAGLRSFDASMPEEINRVLTDHISSLLFTHRTQWQRELVARRDLAGSAYTLSETA